MPAREMIAERGMDTEAQILAIIRDMLASPFETRLSVKNLRKEMRDILHELRVTHRQAFLDSAPTIA